MVVPTPAQIIAIQAAQDAFKVAADALEVAQDNMAANDTPATHAAWETAIGVCNGTSRALRYLSPQP